MISMPDSARTACKDGAFSKITIVPRDVAVMARAGEVILDAIRRYGYTYRFGCRRGGCGRCKVRLLRGSVEETGAIAETALNEAERSSGLILSCRSLPTTEVWIGLLDDDHLESLTPLLAPVMAKQDRLEKAWVPTTPERREDRGS